MHGGGRKMKLTLGKELGLGFGTILLLMLVSAGMSYIKLADIREAQQNILEVRAPTIEACKDLQSHLQEAASDARQGILAGENPARRAVAAASFASAWESIEKDSGALQKLSPRWDSQENRERLSKIKERLGGVRQGQQALMAAAASGDRDAVVRAGNEYADKLTPEVEQLASVLRELTDSFDGLRNESENTLAAANSSLIWSMSLTTLAALVIGAVVAVFLSRRIGGSVTSILAQADAIAEGDLTRADVKVISADELGDLTAAVNKMQGKLRGVIESISRNAQQVATASEEFSATSQQITANSEETSAQAQVVSARPSRNRSQFADGGDQHGRNEREHQRNCQKRGRIGQGGGRRSCARQWKPM